MHPVTKAVADEFPDYRVVGIYGISASGKVAIRS